MTPRKTATAAHSFTFMPSVIQPHLQNRGSLAAMAQELTTARLALAIRAAQPDAVQVASLQICLRQQTRA